MDTFYYQSLDEMEKKVVDKDYLQGWAGGYLQTPKHEEQRVTDGYEAGYEVGENKRTDHMANWTPG